VEILFVRHEQKDCNGKPDPQGNAQKTIHNSQKTAKNDKKPDENDQKSGVCSISA